MASIIFRYDIGIYKKLYIFDFCPISGTGLLKLLEFPMIENNKGIFYHVNVRNNKTQMELFASNAAKLLVAQCLTLCDPMDYSLPSSSVHGILQAKILKWVAISFSSRSSRPRNQTQVSCIGVRFLTSHQGGPKPRFNFGFNLSQ